MLKVKNFTRTFLAAPITSATAILTVSAGSGAVFPPLLVGDFTYATLIHPSSNLREIVKIIDINGDAFTVLRGQDDSSPADFPVASELSIQWNKQQVLEWVTQTSSASITAQVNAAVAAAFAAAAVVIPNGTIVFSVTMNPAAPPTGWLFCDGTLGTPDLRGRFPLGASGAFGAAALQIGGESTHVLTIGEMPSHTHAMNRPAGADPVNGGASTANYDLSANGTQGVQSVLAQGGGAAHNTMPPYLAGNWFMKQV